MQQRETPDRDEGAPRLAESDGPLIRNQPPGRAPEERDDEAGLRGIELRDLDGLGVPSRVGEFQVSRRRRHRP